MSEVSQSASFDKNEITRQSVIDSRSSGNELLINSLNDYYTPVGSITGEHPARPRNINKADNGISSIRNKTTSSRYALNQKLAEASHEAHKMKEFASTADKIELSIAGFNLKRVLQDLWDLRKERENDWRDLLTHLHSAISGVAFETFTVNQCTALINIIDNYLTASVDLYDLKDSNRLLKKSGLDPWKTISFTDGDINE